MRRHFRTLAVAAAVAAVTFARSRLLAGDDDDADSAAAQKAAQDALDKAVARGKDLFHSGDLGKKACASCHENAEKPQLNLSTRSFAYPAFSKRARAVISLGQ